MRLIHVCSLSVTMAALPVLAGIDDPAKPWSYFVHPVTCIGMPLQTARTGIKVTPEGTVFTGEHELALFFGDERKPLACRQRRFVDDMPIVEDEWRDGDCHYRWTLFGATLPCDARNENTAVFARLEVQNVGTDAASPKIWASMKASGGFRHEGRARRSMPTGATGSAATSCGAATRDASDCRSSTLRERMRSSPRWANRMTGRLRRRKSASVPRPTRALCCTVRT